MRLRWSIRLTAAAALCALAVGAFPGTASAGTTEEAFLFKIINVKRAAKGKKVLKEHKKILSEARNHSAAMASSNTLSHDGFTGRASRIRNADGGINGGICENVAYVSGYSNTQDALRVIYRMWRNSPGHKKCMFDKLGWSSESGALGLKHSGNTWWATFIAAHDSSP